MTRAFDVLIIGGGHNGLAAAIHACRAGLTAMVLEASEKIGGAAITVEPLLPGFRHNPHAKVLVHADIMPLAADLELSLPEVTCRPVAQLGVAFSDGRPPAVLHRTDALERTVASLGKHSRADAATWSELKQRSAGMGSHVRALMFSPPDRAAFGGHAAAAAGAYGDMCDRTRLGQRSARELIDNLFRAPECRLLFYNLAQECGLTLNEQGSDLAFLSIAVWTAGRWRLPMRGMQVVSDGLRRIAIAAGADVAVDTRVRRILMDGGRAVGVQTADGSRIAARKAVLSAAPITELFDQLVDRSDLSAQERGEIDQFRRQAASGIATSFVCLTRKPHYRSARHDPEIDKCLKTAIGHDSPEDLLAENADLDRGLLPHPAGIVCVPTLWDASQAPAGSHAAAVDSRFPNPGALDEDQWHAVESAFPEALTTRWAEYAPNMADAVLTSLCDARGRFERRMLLRMGDQQYRTSIRGLYMCGQGIFPGGGVNGASAHNAVGVILRDLGARQTEPSQQSI